MATGASRATLAGKVESDFLKTTILIFFSGECGGAELTECFLKMVKSKIVQIIL